ncbi:UDP-N-acetylmuramate dehydrogenase [Geomonas sp. RF6]|uniref:UDP-N-acetylmuramate dehydrogenase n=1 Tax=Geomonas sp. RF6 TaxID=2897342 RepID=UPI001E2A96C0|nr:UDP-N-acetylmuramate dehydrogenase [Geomonas sp. RF6]UFS72831.1 UDP-N-acetylmuramate dehydrogenase [Geomonas sp. RF6]
MIIMEKEVRLAPFTSFRIGGAAKLFCAVSTKDQLRQAITFALQKDLPYHILGGGTNILVNDSGFPGMVIQMNLDGMRLRGESVEVDAGVELMRLVQCATQEGLGGMERLAGIPGTVGGAVRGNAGAYGTAIGEVVRGVVALDLERMEFIPLTREECDFHYRSSTFKKTKRLVVVSALLDLHSAPREEIAEKVEETLAKRLARNLQAELSVGSFFMNPVVTERSLVEAFEGERRVHCRDNRIPAGWFIERAGLRNRRVGGAMVSEKHANYIINTGNATARDVRELAALIRDEVAQKTGVLLQEEVCYLGF